MSGIAGWVDFEREVARERHAVLAMTAALAGRGPHGDGLWACPRAVLGQRGTGAVNEYEGGRPVVVAEQGRPVAVISYDGSVSNAARLRRQLTDAGEHFSCGSEAEVVLRAYLRWGTAGVQRLEGMFAFAIWDLRVSQLILVRDRMGIKPLTYQPLEAGVLFGSEPKAVLAHPLAEARVDADGLRAVLTAIKVPGRSVFRGLREVAPGHLVKVGVSGIHTEPYWQLRPRPHTEDLDETVDTVRRLLTTAVTSAMAGEPAAGILLSGGLDSSAMAALAASQAAAGEVLRTFTVGIGANACSVPDSPYVSQVVEHLGTQHLEASFDPQALTDPVVRTAVLTAKDLPTPYGDKNITPYLFFRSVGEHVKVALSGEAADTVFGGFAWADDPSVVQAEMFPWLTVARQLGLEHGIGAGLLDPALLKWLDLDTYCTEQYHGAIAEVEHLPDSHGLERRMRELSYLHLTRWLDPLLLHSERLGTAGALEIRFPFCDHRLVEYMYNTPWAMKSHCGRERSLLRSVVRELLPPTILARPKTPFPVTYDDGYKTHLRDSLAAVLADPHAPVAALLDTKAARAVVEDPRLIDRGGWLGRADVEMALQLNTWLDRYGIRLVL
ncbi:asparagine synthase (glutamine-hydrolyzing) [Kitasatospora kifunensis]|uniref:asparagine synthase (glutamine-hydrolyzing) n=1 Tax=Kitasatospora kifunensis TaxID=58351 RepID=A0A7W7R8D5_KITKI|nr:asparagine synthase (glutamine-hydrolyzing) [Kitasatospora kifunensis]MBB4927322.1 asparagine synthase (glutamine-hydrolyzing) [Kitasatospora kifunensis]